MTGDLRASDGDRDNVADHLRKNCVAGRITLVELEQRLEGVMAARGLLVIRSGRKPRSRPAAERALTARIGHDHWHTPRVEEMLPWLRAAVGARPRLPAGRALDHIRYTPITRQFKSVAALSWRLAQLQGYSAAGPLAAEQPR